jgi:hypothetical protein
MDNNLSATQKLDRELKKTAYRLLVNRILIIILIVIFGFFVYEKLIDRSYSFIEGVVVDQKPYRSYKSYYRCRVALEAGHVVEVGCNYRHQPGVRVRIERIVSQDSIYYNLAVNENI